MKRDAEAGFTLVEMVFVLIIGGLLIAMTVPAFKSFAKSNDMKSAAKSVASQLTLAREKAISTGTTQTIRFMKDFQGSDYHVWSNSVASPSWKLPQGVTYASGIQDTYRMTSDGRCLDSGMIILQNTAGIRDTISVRLSGLILVY